MTANHHPLTTLRAEELPGYAAMAKRAEDLLEDIIGRLAPDTALLLDQLQRRFEDDQAIAEGMLARADAAAQGEEAQDEQALAENIAQAITAAPQDSAALDRAAVTAAVHIERAAAPPASSEAPKGLIWTPERLALLDADYGTVTARVLLDRINALPGPPCASVDALIVKAGKRRRDGLLPRPTPAAAPTPITIWSEERDALLRRAWPDATLSLADILTQLRALPGDAPSTEAAIRARASKLALGRRPTVDEGEPAAEFTSEDLHEAREMLARGASGRDLHTYFGGTLAHWADFAAANRPQKDAA